LAELESPLGLVEDRDAEDVRRKEVAGELDAPERTVEGTGQRRCERGLAHSRYVLDHQVAACEEAHDRELHGLGLAEHCLLDGGFELAHPDIERFGTFDPHSSSLLVTGPGPRSSAGTRGRSRLARRAPNENKVPASRRITG